jgi:transaldolase / glucose-6-phosphate isomerase
MCERTLVDTLNQQTIALPQPLMREVALAQDAWRSKQNTRRLWSADAALWTGGDEGDWLGWLHIAENAPDEIAIVREFGQKLRAENFTDVLLLGMGGSSLGPEVLAESLGSAPGYPKLHVLDSTDPQQVRRFEHGIDIERTLFIVSSKSGTTLEPNVLMDYFFARAAAAIGEAARRHFVAITDPGSKLQNIAEAQGFRRVFFGVPSIGGRYSVLSNFGMVPLAATGHDPQAFIEAARSMVQACGPETPAAENPGVALGLAIGVLALAGRDKLTFIASPSIAAFGAWAEQLLAESTGKNGRGVIPLADEPLGAPSVYDEHRLFVYLRDVATADTAQDRAVDALEHDGQPVIRINIRSAALLGQEFFRFEIATAVAGAVLGINPFDQPDVEASKTATRQMTAAFEQAGSLPFEPPVFEDGGIALYTDARNASALRQLGADSTLESWLKAHFARLNDGDYFALLAYVDAEAARLRTLQGLRSAVRDRRRVATTLEFGPRFLHSTGQAYKGGPNSGVFLQITTDASPDLAIPGRKASFGVVEAAQARGDFRVLTERGRRALHAHIASDVDAGIDALDKAARQALA